MANTAQSVLDIARKEIGYSRWNDPQQGTKYGRWFRDVLKWGSYYGENGVPYCGMFTSWVFAQAGASCAGIPGAYTPTMLAAGKKAGKAVATKDAKPGDVVYFDWGGDGVTDHVGIVESNNGSYLTTIEGNTTGTNGKSGGVNRRTREYKTVSGVIRPNYNTSTATPPNTSQNGSKPSQSTTVKNQAIAEVQKWCNTNYGFNQAVDGVNGANTRKGLIRALQTELNKQYGKGLVVDGICGAKTQAACVVVKHGAKGNLSKTLQGALIVKGYDTGGFDGEFGSKTLAAVKAFQKAKGLTVDGEVGKNTWKALLTA